jgi:hypothetical protein
MPYAWVQILHPGPLLPVLEVRYYFKFIFGKCRTKSPAIPMPYPPVCRQTLLLSTIQKTRRQNHTAEQIEGTTHVSTLVGLGVCQTEDDCATAKA